MIRSQAMGARLAGMGLGVVLLMGLVASGGPPKWVEKGSGVMNEKDSKAFYGVGSVVGVLGNFDDPVFDLNVCHKVSSRND
ncbi:MAG: hypothetical protein HP494_11950 [Nitrospira sp.]|nr:hypothetical protein [Nitrospira sp.]